MESSPPLYTPCLPLPSHDYIRSFEAEIDYLEDATLRIRGVQTDHQHTLAYDWVVRFPTTRSYGPRRVTCPVSQRSYRPSC